MNITKHGEEGKENNIQESFKCEQCGCEFTADYDEYYIEKSSFFNTSTSATYTYSANDTDKYICSCPECHKIVTKTKQRTVEIPCTLTEITGTDSSSYIQEDR